ncbi:hypothetical protein R1flu_008448 [Riccia fluitans]|uniref:Uncharacterized protein n=1 Tax=Riccia fluitans TaxID=41844 RepID=A0ABD1YBR1_9MARC
MKIEDGPLNRYLIKNLQSLTEADPSLLANYVAALLRNNKPKKELQKLCTDQLYDFLGDGTKSFVAKLFHALEDGTVLSSKEEMESSKPFENLPVVSSTEMAELRTSPLLGRLPSTAVPTFSDEGEGKSSDDEDDDRNHKHRRRVTRSRSFDRDGDGGDSGFFKKRGRSIDSGQGQRESESMADDRTGGHAIHSERDNPTKFERRMGREHGSGRFISEGGPRGNVRAGPQFRGEGLGPRFDGQKGMMRGGMGRGRGLGASWPPHEQRFPPSPFSEGLEFAPPLLPPGPQASGFFAGRGIPGRGVPHSPWLGYGPHPGIGNSANEHAHPMSGGMQGGRELPPLSAGIGLNVNMGRPRCLDFEERGYCLRGDLCPMEHGANRIVVEDVQSLSKFNLPVSIPSGRGMGSGPASGPSAVLAPGFNMVNRGNRVSRETRSLALGECGTLLNVAAPSSGGAEPDLYDPDQPLWSKERLDTSSGLSKLPSYQKRLQDSDWDNDLGEKRENRESCETVDIGRVGRGGSSNSSQGTESGASVWDRIGPLERVGTRLDGGPRPASSSLECLHGGKVVKKEGADKIPARGRGGWEGKWNSDVTSNGENALRGVTTNSTVNRGRGNCRSETSTGQVSVDGTSYRARGTGSRGSSGFGSERAQRTLYVSFIPVQSNKTEPLTAHFQKFGHVLDIRIPAHSDRAFVQFSRREDAEAALTAPDAVMGNRFIRLSWANRDSIPDPGDNITSTSTEVAGKSRAVVAMADKAALNGSASTSGASELAPCEGAVKNIVSDGSAGLAAMPGGSLKRQGELEKMKEAIRIKQELLAQKRVDFRRKLEARLAKQGSVQGDVSDSELSVKRQKLDDAEDSTSALVKQITSVTTVIQSSAIPPAPEMRTNPYLNELSKVDLVEVTKQTTGTAGMNQPSLPSPRSGRLQNRRVSCTNLSCVPVSRGPARFKLDNRTTVFRVLPPFPSVVSEVAVLKEHFAMFGELSGVDLEGAEDQKAGGTKLSEIHSVRISFATRRSAERAFVQGKWLQGHCLQLVWVTTEINSSGAAGNPTMVISKGISSKGILEAPSGQQGENGSRYSDDSVEMVQVEEKATTSIDGDLLVGESGHHAGVGERRVRRPFQT